jgi:hypothetical protein
MNRMDEIRELARRFNEDEAVWRRFQKRRALRRLRRSGNRLPDDILDDFDWAAAERECRGARVVGFHVQ